MRERVCVDRSEASVKGRVSHEDRRRVIAKKTEEHTVKAKAKVSSKMSLVIRSLLLATSREGGRRIFASFRSRSQPPLLLAPNPNQLTTSTPVPMLNIPG